MNPGSLPADHGYGESATIVNDASPESTRYPPTRRAKNLF